MSEVGRSYHETEAFGDLEGATCGPALTLALDLGSGSFFTSFFTTHIFSTVCMYVLCIVGWIEPRA